MIKKITSIIDTIQFLLFVSFVSISFLQVFFRYVLNNSLTWAEEINRYMFIWLVFLGSALCIQRRTHIGVDLLISNFKGLPKKVILTINDVLIIGLMLILFREGLAILPTLWMQYSSALGIPMAYIYASVPVGAALMGIYSLLDIWRIWYENETASTEGQVD
ncbi:2,3-diketo-L-gulonate TRAP transporter small permease protein YiaM [Neomoorella glycerini]|uniref:2,3-diketo-L-gulonate TRAP transporter small permease protein YiaM n=1 Tax=Neomoorella glycerini TaxID=55779 RepID=A0A6I5ZTR8_9FIRM|nr:TRAP transporter small permease [Moorella glycerini]QGP92771.1 2,3-diketo-L-gulonate TRAP transporter small permease protein YiaM [Moorella glycerini]